MATRLTAKRPSSLFLSICLVALVSCGADSGNKGAAGINQLELQNDPDGIYRAVLSPLNTQVADETKGIVTVRMFGDELVVHGAISGAPVGIRHFQYLTDGSRCPDQSADINGDGFIDSVEGESFYGKGLIPLDSNLETQIDGSDFGPIANPAGVIIYKESVSLSKLLADLMEPDPNEKDHLQKLVPGRKLFLTGKKIIIQGVEGALPASVASNSERTNAETLPIACGELVRVTGEEGPVGLGDED